MYDSSKPLIDDAKKPSMINKLCRVLGGLLTLLIVITIGLSLFIRFYLTEERLKEIIIPPAETALARSVTLGTIDVGLFSGITIKNLAIKEADNADDFLAMERFVLHYNLLALLQKSWSSPRSSWTGPPADCTVTATAISTSKPWRCLPTSLPPPKNGRRPGHRPLPAAGAYR